MNMNVIDLFAGCGGMSTGFEMAGYHIPLALEKDEWASATYRFNHPETDVVTADIKSVENPCLLIKDKKIDGLIGGPPCQGFSLSGHRDRKDPRNSLFMEFVRFAKAFKPKFFVMENVPGILSMRTKYGEKVSDVIFSQFSEAGYNSEAFILNAAEFGVPQNRMRVFFIGIRKDFPFDAEQLSPKGFLLGKSQITINQAIMDLPQIQAGEGQDPAKYQSAPQNDYQAWARNGSEELRNHIAMKHTKRLVERFSHIGYGQSVADVDAKYQQRQRGAADRISGKIYSQNNMRPFPDKPSPTVPASFQSNFVHPFLNRNYTAREGARLQSFPDRYVFLGKRTTMSWEKNLSQYQQIGNAVPPLLAKAIALQIKKYFEEIGVTILFSAKSNNGIFEQELLFTIAEKRRAKNVPS